MIWQFNNSCIYVLGAVHFMRENQNIHIHAINETLKNVSQVIFETSLDFPELPITKYENGHLSENISKALFKDAKKVGIKYGISPADLDKFKIWYAALVISNQIYNSIGLSFKNGVDSVVWELSCNSNKVVSWLEDYNDGLLFFDNSPKEEQINFLTAVVRDKNKVVEGIGNIIEGWAYANENALRKVLTEALDKYPVMFRGLILERNILWVSKFLEVIKSDTPTLFVIGALHCIGDGGILDILHREHGYASRLINQSI